MIVKHADGSQVTDREHMAVRLMLNVIKDVMPVEIIGVTLLDGFSAAVDSAVKTGNFQLLSQECKFTW